MAEMLASATRVSNVAVTIGLCFAVAVLEGFDIQAMGVAAPRLGPEFGLTPGQMGWLFSISNIGLVLGASFGGWLADRVGRKPVFIGSVVTFGLFTLATSQAPDYPLLFIARLLTGLGFGAALPNMMAVAAEISTPAKRASTAAAIFCGLPLGGGLSALVTQVLPPEVDWRVLFMIGGGLPLVLAPALYLLMQETMQRTASSSVGRPNVAVVLFAGGRAIPTLLLWLTFFPTLLVLYLILNWLPTLVVANGLERAVAPQAALTFNFASVVGALIIGRLVDRLGARWPLVLAYAVLIGALLALSRSTQLESILLWSAVCGLALTGANYSLYGVAASYYSQEIRGTGSGASVAVGRVGSVVGPMLAGLLLGAGATATVVMQLMAPVAALAGAAVFALSFYPRPE
jgi:MFS transporter, AAHS family, 3-hydroxyphenylpropionic acid transporter